ncbi:MAG: tRNA uridine(34) 5-carboxymethylaminomethyl modification radical SAM/GNAT enzyme Elp3 [Candidatus Pacearchaeota archaeon]
MKPPLLDEVRKPSKTLAGVTPIAVMCKPKKCRHGTCVYCPSLNVPQSYTPKSPPVLRAERLAYDSYEQVISRLNAFEAMHHPTDKIEIIIMGGNFLEYPGLYQNNFILGIYNALNRSKSRSLEEAKKKNEKSLHRCVALCIETRPDSCSLVNIKKMLSWGTTRVEIGVQCLDDEIYKKVNRGHKVKDVVIASKILRDYGFKVGYHMMLGLPGSDSKKDLKMFKELFEDSRFKPDQLKIYPCQVLQGSRLADWHKKGKYKPYTKEQTEKLLIKIMKIIPNYCRVMRIMREIHPDFLIEGTTRIDLRKDVEEKLKKENADISEIRFREVGFNLRDLEKGEKITRRLNLKITKYKASNGEEYFLEFINKENILFGLLRLRVFDNKAIVRELHVYGQALGIGEKGNLFGQHLGLGKKLLSKAEEIAKKENANQLQIISGVGVREYYKKLGYKLKEEYMEKKL